MIQCAQKPEVRAAWKQAHGSVLTHLLREDVVRFIERLVRRGECGDRPPSRWSGVDQVLCGTFSGFQTLGKGQGEGVIKGEEDTASSGAAIDGSGKLTNNQ